MDISRIEAFNPNRINWKILTAKEIMKYERQGIEVPNVYLQWAQEFINSVNNADNDDITYEAAKSGERHNSETKDLYQGNTNDINVDTAASETQETDTNTQNTDNEEQPQLTKAQTKRQQMADNGLGLREQAITFRKDSNNSAQNATFTTLIMQIMENESSMEEDELEAEISKLLSEASTLHTELNTQINNINNNNSDNTTFTKIERLQEQLKRYGNQGQNRIYQTETALNAIGDGLNTGTPVIEDAKDFGTVTSEVGNELIEQSYMERNIFRIIDYIIGKRALSSGENSILKGEEGSNAQNQGFNTNNTNISAAASLHSQVEEKTGVTAEAKGKKDQPESDTSKEQQTEETKDSDKALKVANNDGTDTTDKADISIDEILKRKIRKGQNIDDNYS